MRFIKKRAINILLAFTILFSSIAPGQSVGAVSKNITGEQFLKKLVQAVNLEVDSSKADPYEAAAMAACILKKEDKIKLSASITRTNASVLLNRADEYLHGNTVDAELMETVIEKRISDIKKIPAGKREEVAKVYAKGIITGYSNGYYIQSRTFKGNNYMTTATANKFINRVLHPKKREKISPDGQVIRTTNLPKNYKKFNYILECFPNSFYEMKFMYQRTVYYNHKPVELMDYACPAKVNKTMTNHLETDKNGMCIYVNDWMDKVELNLKTRLNVNYKTIEKDNTWLNNLRSTYFIYGDEYDRKTTDDIKDYIKFVKKNKIVIQSKIVAVEPSTMYLDGAHFYVRTYVKFKVSFAGDRIKQDDLFYGRNTKMYDIKADKWFTGVYDISVATVNGRSDGSDYAVSDDSLNDYFYKRKN